MVIGLRPVKVRQSNTLTLIGKEYDADCLVASPVRDLCRGSQGHARPGLGLHDRYSSRARASRKGKGQPVEGLA